MASGFAAGAGADMLQEVLRRKFAEAIAQQKLAEDIRQANMQNQVQQAQLGQGQQRIGLQERELGQQVRQYEDAAPLREATLGHVNAETSDLQGRPAMAEAARAAAAAQAEAQRQFTGSQNDLNRQNATRIANINGAKTIEAAKIRAAGKGESQTGSDYGAERATRMRDMISEILPSVDRTTAGVGSVFANVPETGARNLRAKLDALKANVGFKELQEMRNASKTGGALGQVSDTENRLLASALGSLDQGQSPAQLKQTLTNILGSLDRWEAAKAKFGAPGATGTAGKTGTGFRVIGEVK
jgi:hypothetical protein